MIGNRINNGLVSVIYRDTLGGSLALRHLRSMAVVPSRRQRCERDHRAGDARHDTISSEKFSQTAVVPNLARLRSERRSLPVRLQSIGDSVAR
jgi:hypothetical protein